MFRPDLKSAFSALFVMGSLVAAVTGQQAHDGSGNPSTWDHATLVDHARGMFRQLVPLNIPVWEHREMGWRDQCDVNLTEGACQAAPVAGPETVGPAGEIGAKAVKAQFTAEQLDAMHFAHSLTIPPQFRMFQALHEGADFNLPANPAGPNFPAVLQTIYYNAPAVRTILGDRLNSASDLEQELGSLREQSAPLQDMVIPDFPPDAVIIKTFWETVQPVDIPPASQSPDKNSDNGKETGRKKDTNPNRSMHHLAMNPDLFRFGQAPDQNGRYSSLNPMSDPTNFVDIDTDDHCERSTTDRDNNGTPGTYFVYSLGCFYWRPVIEAQLEARSSQPSAVGDIGDPFCYVAAPQHCYMILVGVHVMTRETPNWLWMTFWWSTRWWDKDHKDQPQVPNKWDLFDANAAANNTDPVANPYLEGPTSGMFSNCMECHRHAVFHPNYGTVVGPRFLTSYFSGIAGTKAGGPLKFRPTDLNPDGTFKALSSIPPRARDLQAPACYFSAALQTHFLWTIALHSASGPSLDPCKDGPDAPTRNPAPSQR